MAGQRIEEQEASRELSKREEREQRILDAAGELIQKWGYRKTTIDDIAKQARVAKGTIYLHWKTREELFMALIYREETRLFTEIGQNMADDPDGLTLSGMIKHSMLATLKHPLMKALFLRDAEFLGELVTHEYSTASYQAQLQGYITLMEILREHGLVRSDVGLREQVFLVSAISWGCVTIDRLLPDDFRFSDEEVVEMMTATLRRVLEPDRPPTGEERQEEKRLFKAYLDQLRTYLSNKAS